MKSLFALSSANNAWFNQNKTTKRHFRMHERFHNNRQVSIITPCYNSRKYISCTIESVISQTYQDWEMLIIDDCSSDDSASIIQTYCAKDRRIKYLKTEKPSGGPTIPRNIGIKIATGRYIAFLDSDDCWLQTKLEDQIPLFEDDNVAIAFTNYEKITVSGERQGRKIIAPASVGYHSLLKGNCIGCLTAVYDTAKIGKAYFPNVGHEDYALWLSILKKGFIAKNTETIGALYRIVDGSLSSDKLKVFKWSWHILREMEQLPFFVSLYYFINYAVRALMKYLK